VCPLPLDLFQAWY